jgi:hypothetical protein
MYAFLRIFGMVVGEIDVKQVRLFSLLDLGKFIDN